MTQPIAPPPPTVSLNEWSVRAGVLSRRTATTLDQELVGSAANLLLRHPSKAIRPRPVAKSGSVGGVGTASASITARYRKPSVANFVNQTVSILTVPASVETGEATVVVIPI